jgi:serine/threonine protein kinase
MAYFSAGDSKFRPAQKSADVQMIFRNIRILRDKGALGEGSYGKVFYAKCDSLLCAAKCVHEIFFENVENRKALLKEFLRECDMMATMKHPNIVQYLGYYVEPNSQIPCLLMELLDESLTRFLGRLSAPVPFHTSVDFALDISMAMDYLHVNNVMHRDLSSNNVLIIASYRAKVTDFGQSTLAQPEENFHIKGNKNQCPGTQVYMPPESLRPEPIYSSMLDSFSFGVLLIQLLTRQWPEPGPTEMSVPNVGPGGTDAMLPVSEVVRRRNHISMIDSHHPLLQLALYCIKDNDEERPPFLELSNRISEVKVLPEYEESRTENPITNNSRPQVKEYDPRVKELQDQVRQLQKVIDTLESQQLQLQFTLEKKDALIRQLGEDGSLRGSTRPHVMSSNNDGTIPPPYESGSSHHNHGIQHYHNDPSAHGTPPFPRNTAYSTQSRHDNHPGPRQGSFDFGNQPPQNSYRYGDSPYEQRRPSVQQHDQQNYGGQQQFSQGYGAPPTSNLSTYGNPPPTHTHGSQHSHGGQHSSYGSQQQQDNHGSATPLPVPDFKLDGSTYRWYPCTRAPSYLYGGTAICTNGKVYVNSKGVKEIYEFNPSRNMWFNVPPAPIAGFSLVEVEGLLTTIGGYTLESYTNKLYTLTVNRSSTHTWDLVYPPMKESRIEAAAITVNRYIIVAGGETQKTLTRVLTESVEVLNLETKQWSFVDKMPKPGKRMTISYLNNQLFIAGGITKNNQPLKSIMYAQFDQLILPAGLTRRFRNVWSESTMPLVYGSLVAFDDKLFLIGGWDRQPVDSINIMNQHPDTNQIISWTEVGKLAIRRIDAMATMLPGRRLLVIGGRGPNSSEQVLSVAEMACPI